ncbi:heterokaryon incompatibility protein-domain-containing protein [Hypomontagnella monticulosa]|nr:heterokaryon incompatibility protein-domain-containing protein [Hypomontagnella monticulosa]
MAQYEYEHLEGDRRIRLLRLLPSNDPTDPIRCQLQAHSLTEAGQIPRYSALSYVWGDSKSYFPIECDGQSISINRGCFQALNCLRGSLRDPNRSLEFSPYLWVDAICINQSDVEERASQVRLMGDIYSSAETVICFLDSSKELYNIEDLSSPDYLKGLPTAKKHPFEQNIRLPTNLRTDKTATSDNFKLIEPVLHQLFESKYWSRLWTFQEALLSHRKIILSGTGMIEWEYAGRILRKAAVKERENFHQSLLKAIHFHALTTASPILRRLLDRSRAAISGKRSRDLTKTLSLEVSRILSFSSGLETSDPRDKIFALIGLMAALEIDLQIDYCRPMPLIYAENVSMFIKMGAPFVRSPFESRGAYSFWNVDFGFVYYGFHAQAVKFTATTKDQKWKNQVPGHQYKWSMKFPSISTITTPKEEVTNWSEDDSSTISSLLQDSIEELDYTSLVRSLTHSVLIRRKNWLIERVCARLGPILSQCANDRDGYRHQKVSTNWSTSAGKQDKLTRGRRTKNQGTQRDRDEHSDDEEDQEHPRKRNRGNNAGEIKKLLACPFHQRDPQRPSTHRSCNGPGWASISRLKEHLYRAHFAHRCRRCKSRFETAAELDNHYQDVTPCAVSSITPDPMEGFNESQRDRLKSRRMQDWKEIYLVLFPNDEGESIPSQYYAEVVAIADILDQLDHIYEEEVGRLLPERLDPILDRFSSSPRTTIQNDLLTMISDIHSTVIQSFRQQMAGMVLDRSGSAPQGNPTSAVAPGIESSLESPAGWFLNYLNTIDAEGGVPPQSSTNLGFEFFGV